MGGGGGEGGGGGQEAPLEAVPLETFAPPLKIGPKAIEKLA